MLRAYIFALITHSQDADDVLQEAKVRMWRAFGQFQSGTNFAAWSRKVAFHQVLSYRKRRKRDRLEFSGVAKGRVQQAADPAAKPRRQLLGSHADVAGERNDREHCNREDQVVALGRKQLECDRKGREREGGEVTVAGDMHGPA